MYVIMKMICLWEGGFEDTKGVIRICKSRTDNTMANRKNIEHLSILIPKRFGLDRSYCK
jgi:hypothetical protein